MDNLTVTHRYLTLDWDGNSTLRISRTDGKGSIELSVSEWKFILQAALLAGWPMHPPIPVATEETPCGYEQTAP